MKKLQGFTLIELMVVVSIIGILALIAIPNFINLRQKAWDASARSAGKGLQLSEHIYRNVNPHGHESFTDDIDVLLEINRNLFEDPGVTIVFLHASESGFTFYSEHAQGTGKKYIYTD